MTGNTRFDLGKLEAIIARRAKETPDVSYTARLLAKGVPHIAKKLGEEASETIIAAVSESDDAVLGEAADLLYHLLVLLHARGIALDEIHAILEARTGQSGLEEKAGRGKT